MVEQNFTVKDSGARQQFASGMVRDTTDGKIDYSRVLDGPMVDRWAAHLTKACAKYADVAPGVPNWTLADGQEELVRFKKSALRHFMQWFRGEVDEDHASAVFFNINGAEYVKQNMAGKVPARVSATPMPGDVVTYEPPAHEIACGETFPGDKVPCALPVDHAGAHTGVKTVMDDHHENFMPAQKMGASRHRFDCPEPHHHFSPGCCSQDCWCRAN